MPPRRRSTTHQDSLPRRPKTPPDCCAVCAVTDTAEWRKGPAGNRSLCNGCGLLAAKRAKERELQGYAPPATLDEIERELETIERRRTLCPSRRHEAAHHRHAGEDEGGHGRAAGVGAETLEVQLFVRSRLPFCHGASLSAANYAREKSRIARKRGETPAILELHAASARNSSGFHPPS
ncbi:GATA zinc finger domain-containing protein 14 [Rhodotorula toruloides]|nr:GATA zinc finger domain-containing protein 14 [Rhodotorula toruloides]